MPNRDRDDLDDLDLRAYLDALSAEVDAGVPDRPVSARVAATRTRIPWVAVAAAAVLVVAFVVLTGDELANDVDTVGPADTTTSSVDHADGPSLGPPVPGEWRALDDVVRATDSHAALVWTGDGLLGVYPENGGGDVTIQRWDANLENPRLAAPSGQPWRTSPTIVWTGTHVVVAGGTNGPGIDDPVLLYDPETDTWDTGSPPPGFEAGSETGIGETGVWVGAEVLFTREALAYDPDRDSWRSLTPSPVPDAIAVAATPSGAFQWGHCPEVADDDPCARPGSVIDGGARYSLADDTWTELPADDGPDPRADMLAVTVGDDVAVVPVRSGLDVPTASPGVLDGPSGTWTMLPDSPARAGGRSDLVASPLGLVYGGGNVGTTVLRPGAEQWQPLGPDALVFNGGALGLAGDRVAVTGIGGTWVFEPGEASAPCPALTGQEHVVGRLVVTALPVGFVAAGPVEEASTEEPVGESGDASWTQRFVDPDGNLLSVSEVNTDDPRSAVADAHRGAAAEQVEIPMCWEAIDGIRPGTRLVTVSGDDAGVVAGTQTWEYGAFVVRGGPSLTRDDVLLVASGIRG